MLLRFFSVRQLLLRAAAVLACVLSTAAVAEVRIEGTPAALQVTTGQDAVADVLAALATNLGVKYRTSVPLDRAANAAYTGSLRDVIARLLDGYNYVLRRDGEATEVVVFGQRGEAALPARPSKSAMPSVTSRWK
jgi:hypothetical protein